MRLKTFFLLISLSFILINCDILCPGAKTKNTSSVGNDVKIKEKHYEKKDNIIRNDFLDNYSRSYSELVSNIDILYDKYESEHFSQQDKEEMDELVPPSEFVSKVREIVKNNEAIYEETCKQIDNYTCKIPKMPWAYGCTIRSTVMYILHNPIIKCAVQHFEHYKDIKDESGCSFDQMVNVPENYMHEWHNCMVMFIRLLKLTYEELERDDTDTNVHGNLWNQIQGLEYLMHFLTFSYRRGWVKMFMIIYFLKMFLKILGVFDFGSEQWKKGKMLYYSLYCASAHSFYENTVYNNEYISPAYDSLCYYTKGKDNSAMVLKGAPAAREEILWKDKRSNYICFHVCDGTRGHYFNFYKKPSNAQGENVYYIHDGWYEYKQAIPALLQVGDFGYHEIPFTYIILPKDKLRDDLKKVKLQDYFNNYMPGPYWDFLIPLLSTELDFVKHYCENFLGQTLVQYFDGLENFYNDTIFSFAFEKFICSVEETITYSMDIIAYSRPGKSKYEVMREMYANSQIENKSPDIPSINVKLKQKRNSMRQGKNILSYKERVSQVKKIVGGFINVDLINCVEQYLECSKKLSDFLQKGGEITRDIKDIFYFYVKNNFFKQLEFSHDTLVIEGNSANDIYSKRGHYNKNDVLKVDWDKTGLKDDDFAIFRKEFQNYKFFKSYNFN